MCAHAITNIILSLEAVVPESYYEQIKMDNNKLFFIGWKQSLGYKADSLYDVSLICEEDLLTTIFCACDIKHTGLPVAFHCSILFSSQQIFKAEIVVRFLRRANLCYA